MTYTVTRVIKQFIRFEIDAASPDEALEISEDLSDCEGEDSDSEQTDVIVEDEDGNNVTPTEASRGSILGLPIEEVDVDADE
jgi:hypothetical protein